MLTVIFISYSKAVLPIEIDIAADKSGASDDESKEDYVNMMSRFRDSLFADAKSNIVHAQLRQKEDYDKKHGKKKVYSYSFISSLSCNTQCKGEGDEGDQGIPVPAPTSFCCHPTWQHPLCWALSPRQSTH